MGISNFFDADELADRLRKGSMALFPTDTLPAIGACPKYAWKLWQIKRRPLEKPLILMGSSEQDLFDNVSSIALNDALLIAKKYWPGALTIVVPCKGSIVDALNPGKFNLGLRVPDSLYARNLLNKTGPIATSSANLSGMKTPLSSEEISNSFPEVPLLGPIPWPKFSGLASTVISWKSPGSWELLRTGAIVPENLHS